MITREKFTTRWFAMIGRVMTLIVILELVVDLVKGCST